MPLKKFYCEKSLLLDDLRRFSPIWVLASFASLLLPLVLFFQHLNYQEGLRNHITFVQPFYLRVIEVFPEALVQAGVIACTLYGAVVAFALFQYLFQSRSALAMHAMPITRQAVFLTHYLAGVLMLIIPLVIMSIACIGVLAMADVLIALPYLFQLCMGVLGMFLFFFSFAIFCVMLTGQLWSACLYYVVLQCLAAISYAIFQAFANMYLYGYTSSSSDIGEKLAITLTPFWRLTNNLSYYWAEGRRLSDLPAGELPTWIGMEVIGCYALAGIIIAAIAYGLFRERNLETAGEVIAVSLLRPVFACCISVYGGCIFTILISSIFRVTSFVPNILFLLFGSAVGYFVAQMLLQKSLAVFCKKTFLRFAVLAALVLGCFTGIYFDGLGYVSYTPKVEELASASVYVEANAEQIYLGRGPFESTSPEDIQAVIDFQKAIVAEYKAEQAESDTYIQPEQIQEVTAITAPDGSVTPVYKACRTEITYTFTSGRVERRVYTVRYNETEVQNPESPAAKLNVFLGNAVDVLARFTAARESANISLVQDETGTSMQLDRGSKRAVDGVDAILADLQENHTKASCLEYNYHEASNWRYITLSGESFYYTVWVLPDTALEEWFVQTANLNILL